MQVSGNLSGTTECKLCCTAVVSVAQAARVSAASKCPFCDQHVLSSCGLYNSIRDAHSDLFSSPQNTTLCKFFTENKTCARLCYRPLHSLFHLPPSFVFYFKPGGSWGEQAPVPCPGGLPIGKSRRSRGWGVVSRGPGPTRRKRNPAHLEWIYHMSNLVLSRWAKQPKDPSQSGWLRGH